MVAAKDSVGLSGSIPVKVDQVEKLLGGES
jgi:hypothetical protein